LFEVEALLDHEVVTFARGKGRNKKLKASYRLSRPTARKLITSGSQGRDFCLVMIRSESTKLRTA